MRKLIPAGILLLVILICSSCSPEQTAGTIHIEGDSVTFNTYYGTGVTGPQTSGEFAPGATADYNPWGTAATDRLPKKVAEGQVDTLIWALGLNDISRMRAGWTVTSQDIWRHLFMDVIPDSSCIVIVKPWVLNFSGRPVEEMESLRSWIDSFAATRPNTVVVDWKPVLEEHPEYSSEDGVHIVNGSGGPEARDAMHRQGVSLCG